MITTAWYMPMLVISKIFWSRIRYKQKKDFSNLPEAHIIHDQINHIRGTQKQNNMYLEILIVLWIKWKGMVEIKHKDFIDVVPIMPCHNSSWIMSWRFYGEKKTQIPLSSPTTINPLAQDPGKQGLYWHKNCQQNQDLPHNGNLYWSLYYYFSWQTPFQILKLEKINGTLIILLYVSPSSP